MAFDYIIKSFGSGLLIFSLEFDPEPRQHKWEKSQGESESKK